MLVEQGWQVTVVSAGRTVPQARLELTQGAGWPRDLVAAKHDRRRSGSAALSSLPLRQVTDAPRYLLFALVIVVALQAIASIMRSFNLWEWLIHGVQLLIGGFAVQLAAQQIAPAPPDSSGGSRSARWPNPR